MRTKVILVEATGCGRKVLETYKCNEVKVEAESANSYTVEVTAATFTRIVGESMGYMASCTHCVCYSSKSGMHECTQGYYTVRSKSSQKIGCHIFISLVSYSVFPSFSNVLYRPSPGRTCRHQLDWTLLLICGVRMLVDGKT